jgi:hypothetical protein
MLTLIILRVTDRSHFLMKTTKERSYMATMKILLFPREPNTNSNEKKKLNSEEKHSVVQGSRERNRHLFGPPEQNAQNPHRPQR